MLKRFESIARRYRMMRTPVWLAFLVMAGYCAWLLTAASVVLQDRWLIPSVLLTLWLLLSGSSLLLFAHVPGPANSGLGLLGGIGRRLQRLFFHLLAWFMLAVTLALLVVSAQLMLAWYREHF